jgi:acyl-CoA synthetase (AMP-forming)/AMP-acid ligase II
VSVGPLRSVGTAAAIARTIWRPERPDRMFRALAAMAPWGATIAGGFAASVGRYPRATAIVDDAGPMRAWDLWMASDSGARALRDRGIGHGRTVGILARNHRGFVTAVVATAKVAADAVYLNTSFAGPQLADVVTREGVDLVIHDDEFAPIVAHCRGVAAIDGSELAALTSRRTFVPIVPTRRAGRQIVLTSGTTGRPKGARRRTSASAATLSGLLAVPLRARDTVVIAAPLFHAWGLAHLGAALATSTTVVVHSRFDPRATLAAIDEHRPGGLVVVPVMLQRMLELDDEILARYDTSSLRYIASSGSALGASLTTAVIERFGPILYNVYGSTEVALATVATPADLVAAPATAGRVAPGTTVKVLDDAGEEVAIGTTGRIFVGSGATFEGYTGGGGKENVGGLLSTGDLGHFDEDGRLFVDGRDDDMIISGGENVFPAEIEDLLIGHRDILDAAVVGIPDERYGQVLAAYVVRRRGARLTKRQVTDHVRAHLARYKVPKRVEFRRQLPRTATGKLRRTDLLR